MGKGWGAIIACAALCATLSATPAEAAFPGQTGRSLSRADGDIWTINPDGTGRIRMHHESCRASSIPTGRPTGSRSRSVAATTEPNPGTCASTCRHEVYVMDADGVERAQAHDEPEHSHSTGATWSPDGTRLRICSHQPASGSIERRRERRAPDHSGPDRSEVLQPFLWARRLVPEWSLRLVDKDLLLRRL